MKKINILLLFLITIIPYYGNSETHEKIFYGEVDYVLDGDTIVLKDGTVVRYIGIDAPETKLPKKDAPYYYGKESKEFNEKLVAGKKVKIELDEQEKDPQGRLLAYIFVNDIFVNEELVKEGMAYSAKYPPNLKYQDKFDAAEKIAKSKNIGIWAEPVAHGKKKGVYLEKYFDANVVDVIDGDTIKIEDGRIIQYIGIDAPEMEIPPAGQPFYGKEALEFNKKLVQGKRVTVVLDEQIMDVKGRTLGYVFVRGIFVNSEIVKNGLARVATHPPNVRYEDVLIEAEKDARKNKRGMWK